MSKLASAVVKQAQAWLGKNEAAGTHREIIDLYNLHKPLARGYKVKYTDSWCATFVSAVAIKLGYTDIIPTECSCQKMIDLFKIMGCWVENENTTPKAGDIIFYDWQDSGAGDNKGWSDHVGIVEKVSGGNITVIEGNFDNSVKRRTLAVNGRYIRGYGIPEYDAEPAKKPVDVIAKEVIAGIWGSGSDRKIRLANAGYDYAIVQAKVNEILKGTVTSPNTSIFYKKYTGKSLKVDAVLKAIGVPEKYRGSYSKRKPVAAANGIINYSGTLAQNLKLISLAKQGRLKKA